MKELFTIRELLYAFRLEICFIVVIEPTTWLVRTRHPVYKYLAPFSVFFLTYLWARASPAHVSRLVLEVALVTAFSAWLLRSRIEDRLTRAMVRTLLHDVLLVATLVLVTSSVALLWDILASTSPPSTLPCLPSCLPTPTSPSLPPPRRSFVSVLYLITCRLCSVEFFWLASFSFLFTLATLLDTWRVWRRGPHPSPRAAEEGSRTSRKGRREVPRTPSRHPKAS